MRFPLWFMCIWGMFITMALAGNAEAQRLPRDHFRVVVDEARDDYRMRVGRGVSVRRLLTFANRQLPAGQPPVTQDDFIVENQLHGDSLDRDGMGNLVYVCGHTAHRRRTFSRNPEHWATCPDARQYLKLVADHEWYWVPRRHRPGPVEQLSTDVRAAVEQRARRPIQLAQMFGWLTRWLQAASPVYQPGYQALAETHRAMALAAASTVATPVVPTVPPPPAPIPTSAITSPPREVHPPPSPLPQSDGWTVSQVAALLLVMIVCFFLGMGVGMGVRKPHTQEVHRKSVHVPYERIIAAYDAAFIRPGRSSETTSEEVIEAVKWSRRILAAYGAHCSPFEDREGGATEVMDDVRINRVVLALQHLAELKTLATQYGVDLHSNAFAVFLHQHAEILMLAMRHGIILNPETFDDLLERAQSNEHDPNVVDVRDVALRDFQEVTAMLLGEGHGTVEDLRDFVLHRHQGVQAPMNPMRANTPYMNPQVYPGALVTDMQAQVDELEGDLAVARERRAGLLLPGVQAAAVLATRILPLMQTITLHTAVAGRALVGQARRLQEEGASAHPDHVEAFAHAVQIHADMVSALMRLDERVLELLEQGDRYALAHFARHVSEPPPMLATLMEDILTRQGRSVPPKPPSVTPDPVGHAASVGDEVAPARDSSDWSDLLASRDGGSSSGEDDSGAPDYVPRPPGVPGEMHGIIGEGPPLGEHDSQMYPEGPFAHTPSHTQIPVPPRVRPAQDGKPPGTVTIRPPSVRPEREPAAPPDGSNKENT